MAVSLSLIVSNDGDKREGFQELAIVLAARRIIDPCPPLVNVYITSRGIAVPGLIGKSSAPHTLLYAAARIEKLLYTLRGYHVKQYR